MNFFMSSALAPPAMIATQIDEFLSPSIETAMQRDMTASIALPNWFSREFARLMRLDEPPVIEPLPIGYKTTRALPFLFDIVRSMLMGRALLVLFAAIVSQILFSLQPYGLSRLIDSLSASIASPDAVDDVAIWVAVLFAFWIGGPFFFQLAKLGNVYLIPHLRVAIKARLFQHLMSHTPISFMRIYRGESLRSSPRPPPAVIV